MRFLQISLLSIWMAFASQPLHAQDTIQDVIRAQLAAFADQDWEAAYAFASPSIQQKFTDPAQFARMVTSAYPVIADHAKALFLEAVGSGSARYQMVSFTDDAQNTHHYYYHMIKLDGRWRINGVFAHPVTGSGV